MPVQIANAYAFNVKRLSLTASPISIQPVPPAPPYGAGNGLVGYKGDEVFVLASSLPNAMAVLQAQYGADLGAVSGGAQIVQGAFTTMTGS